MYQIYIHLKEGRLFHLKGDGGTRYLGVKRRAITSKSDDFIKTDSDSLDVSGDDIDT